jgi:hypothetical protein
MDGLKEKSFCCNCCMPECHCDEENSLQGLKQFFAVFSKLDVKEGGGKNKKKLPPEQTKVMEGVRLHGVCY